MKNGFVKKSEVILNRGLLLLFLALFAKGIYGQDIHFSQYSLSPLNLSPALAGVSASDLRVMGNFRSQWTSVPVSYRTYSAGFDKVFYPGWQTSTRFSYGLLLNHDIAGASKLSNSVVSLLGSSTVQLSGRQFMTAGLKFSFLQRTIETDGLEFDRQYQNGIFDPTNANGELFNELPRVVNADFSIGLNWHFQASEASRQPGGAVSNRTKLDVGVGMFHITRPDQRFIGRDISAATDADRLAHRWSMYIMHVLQISESVDLLANVMWQQQGKFDQVVPMAGTRIHVNKSILNAWLLDLAVGYRFFNTRDALIPQIALHFRDVAIGFSYDITLSSFNQANDYYGGPEFSVTYKVNRIMPVPLRFCPIF